MDAQQALQSARALLTWMGPLLAGGALAQAGEHADRATQLLGRTWRALQGWLAHDDDAAGDLRRLERQPEHASRQQLVAEAVAQLAARDASVAAQLEALTRELADLTGGRPGRTHQVTISGNARVGQAIAGDVHGGITVGRMDLGDAGAAPPAARSASAAVPAPAPRVVDATLSADGIHFSYGHALLIGVGTYASSTLSAPATATDAQRLAELLRDEASAAYPEAQVRVLNGAAATRQAILAALDTFPQQISDLRATAVVFFAGHGIQRPDGFYLLPYDYDPAQLAATAISAAQFHAKIGVLRQRAARLIVLLNCCHAGGVGGALLGEENLADGGDAPPLAFYQPLVEGSGQIVISSSKPDQKSGARSSADPALTVFGAQLLAGLQGGVGGDGAGIGVLDLFSYLCTHVPQDARTISYQGQPLEQRPLLYASEVDQNFAMALRRGGAPATLGVENQRDIIRALAQVEIALASYASEAAAPPEVVARRDRLLAQLERA